MKIASILDGRQNRAVRGHLHLPDSKSGPRTVWLSSATRGHRCHPALQPTGRLTLDFTGRRRAEVLSMTAGSISVDGTTVFYSSRGKGGKTGKRELPRPACGATWQWLECVGKDPATMQPDESLSPATRGGRGITSGTFYTNLRCYLKNAGLPSGDVHIFRHSAAKLRRDAEESTEDALARPSPEACRYCSFRGACHPFLESTGPDWEMFRATAKGTVGSVEETRQGPRLTLDVSLGTVRSGTTCRVSAIPEGEPVGVGDTVAVSDAVHSKASNDLRMEWDSVLWRW